MKQIPDLCHQRAILSADDTAFIELATGRRWRFDDIDMRVSRAAAWLRAQGFGKGDRLAVLCHNTPLFFELLFACARADLILVPINWRQTVPELTPILADCAARLLISDAANLPLAQDLAAKAGLPLVPLAQFDAAAEGHHAALDPKPWESDRPWYLLYTSGTTGRPKAVIQTAGMALANAVNIQLATRIDATTQALNFLPLFHTAGINLHTLPVFLAGGTSRMIAKFEPAHVLNLIAEGALTIFFAVPQVYQLLSLESGFAGADLSRVRHWGCGGAPISAQLIEAYRTRGVVICNGMGMTETGPTVFFMDPANALRKIGSVGKPQLLAEVRLMDADGREGEEGELLFRGPGITPGYFGNEEATRAAFTPEGWLRSGDIGRRDPEGFYYIVDRIKDMYISGGENVYPAEVEKVLLTHSAVLEAAVIGVADEKWGEVGHAAVLLRPGMQLDAEALRRHARAALATYKVPKHFTFVPEFPRTAAGKIQKHLLRKMIGEGSA